MNVTPQTLQEFDFSELEGYHSSSEYKIFIHKDRHPTEPGFYIFLFNDGRIFIGHDLIDVIADNLYASKEGK